MLVSWWCVRIIDPVTVFAPYHSYNTKGNFQLKRKHSPSPPSCPLFVKHTNDVSKENVVSVSVLLSFSCSFLSHRSLYNLQLITDRLKPIGNCVCYLELHSKSMNFPHTLCLPFMWFSKNTVITCLNNEMLFLVETEFVYFDIGTEFLCILSA